MAVLVGGRSTADAPAAAVREALTARGHVPIPIVVGADGVWRRDGMPVQVEPGCGLQEVDVVFPVVHDPFGAGGAIQGLLACLGVPYVGAGVGASALCVDKVTCKGVMGDAGIPQVPYRALRNAMLSMDGRALPEMLEALGLPVFVKPARGESSIGVTQVTTREQLSGALDLAFEHDSRAIVEAAASGVEVCCGVIGNDEVVASEPGKIVLIRSRTGWFDNQAKTTPGSIQLHTPGRIPPHVRERVRQLAVRAYELTDCAGAARVDFFVDGEQVLFNEINTMPGLKRTGVFALLFEASGIDYDDLIERLVQLALERSGADRQGSF